MLTARLRARAPSARPVGIGRLVGHKLEWHKRSRDGSGKCDAARGSTAHAVWGVFFEIRLAEKGLLDRVEGLHCGYEEKPVWIAVGSGVATAVLYYATDIGAGLRPYQWYKELVLAGAREHGLPADYLAELERVAAVPDPDRARAAAQRKMLAGAPPTP